MKKVLVTGGAGYVGSHTVKELVKNGYDVLVVDNLETGHRKLVDHRAKLEVADLADKEKLKSIFEKYIPEAVIDFAAYLAVGESMEEPEKYFQNNVANFINLLDAMNEVGCKLLIKSSSAAVYGNPTKESDIPWQEDFTECYRPEKSALLSGNWQGKKIAGEEFFQCFLDHYNSIYADRPELKLSSDEIIKLRIPMSIYGVTKLLDEIVMKKYDEFCGLKSIVLRYFNVCGADPSGGIGEAKPKPTTLMTLAIWQILGRVPELSIFGDDYSTSDGSGVRDYIHPSDLATGHIKALKFLVKNNKSDIFNLGTGTSSSVFEVISAVEKASGGKVKYTIKPRRSGDPAISISDPRKAEKVLNWKAKYNLRDMAETAWKWEINNSKIKIQKSK
ncbi:MAG: UDP-glucose 4-epimerase [Candidatus Berkelbacteria bacterium]|nr:UDP-glucose 4-epimerase [Candidatus Berkelbacteria bacterium]